jgi:hypothetical protein
MELLPSVAPGSEVKGVLTEGAGVTWHCSMGLMCPSCRSALKKAKVWRQKQAGSFPSLGGQHTC